MTAPYSPTFLTPAAPGMLSNARGSNTGGDAITVSARSAAPGGAGDPPTTMRVTAARPAPGGGIQQAVWDSGWMGGLGTQTQLPESVSFDNPQMGVALNGRLYVSTGSTGKIYSAPVSGSSAGTWRQEQTVYNGVATLPATYALATVNGYLYASVQSSVLAGGNQGPLYAQVNADGTLGTWKSQATAGPNTTQYQLLAGYSDRKGVGYLFLWNGLGGGATGTNWGATLNPDGSVAAWTAGTSSTAQRAGGVAYLVNNLDGTAVAWLIGGGRAQSNGTALLSIESSTLTAGVAGAWTTAGTGLPAARSQFAFAQANGFLYVIGGVDAANANAATVYYIASGNIGTNAWATAANALPAAASALVGTGWSILPAGGQTAGARKQGSPAVFACGGGATTVQSNFLKTAATLGDTNGAWLSGTGGTIGAGDLGTGSSVTLNLDGSVDVAVLYEAVAAYSPVAGLTDGDLLTLTVQFASKASGDPSPVSATTLKIGQPPTLSALTWDVPITPHANSEEPNFSFTFTPGAGGAVEASWRFQAKDAGANVVFDTGLRYDAANYALVKPPNGPALQGGAAPYTVTVTASSADSPVPGSTATATATSGGFTPTATEPNAPTNVAATSDDANGLVTVAFKTAAVGAVPATARVYRRLTAGPGAWQLLKAGVPTGASNTNYSVQLMDDIRLGVSYDYAVSSLTDQPAESARSAASTATIGHPPRASAGAYTAMIHVVGSGPTAGHRLGLLYGQPGRVNRKVDAPALPTFGAAAPTIRYGTFNYRELELRAMLLTDADRDTLESILALAAGGSTLCYRDTKGLLIYCGLGPERPRFAHRFNEETIRLVESNFTYSP